MNLTIELQKLFEERTKKFSKNFHEKNCCDEQIYNFNTLSECLSVAKQYINHFQDYYFPKIEKTNGLNSMVIALKLKKQEYIKTCMEFNEITTNDSVDELSECLKIACVYIKEIESDLIELGFKLE